MVDGERRNMSSGSRSPSNGTKRIYIGNLRPRPDLKERLRLFLAQSGVAVPVEEDSVHVVRKTSCCFALVACNDVKHAISCLNGAQCDGRRLVVQREKKQGNQRNSLRGKSSFGGGWARPSGGTLATPASRKPFVRDESKTDRVLSPKTTELKSSNMTKGIGVQMDLTDGGIDEDFNVAEAIGEVVSGEIQDAQRNPLNGDEMNAAVASLAAVSVFASHNAFDLDDNPNHSDGVNDVDERNYVQQEDEMSSQDFYSQCQKPLKDLLEEYGEQDIDFSNQKQRDEKGTYQEEPPVAVSFQNQLAPQGKAPIHVEVVSFGYTHGIPSELRSGWSHSHPLSPLDCRHLPMAPHYLSKQDGLSYSVKRALLSASYCHEEGGTTKENQLKCCANKVALQAVRALEEAIAAGYGHAAPLHMAVYVGSEYGRHRSVAVCEMAATFIRSKLRKNDENRITQPASVGTRHRDIERGKYTDQDRERMSSRNNKSLRV